MQPHRSALARSTTTPAPAAMASDSRSAIGSTSTRHGERDRDEIQEQGERVVREYEETRDRLAKAINSSTYLLADLRNFNESEWTVRYPTLTPVPRPEEAEQTAPRRPTPRRGKTVSMSLSFADQPECIQQVEVEQMPDNEEEEQGRPARRTFRRSITAVQALKNEEAASTAEQASERPLVDEDDEMDEINGFSILRLNLSLGHASTSAQGAAATLITSLEKHSISRLISTRLESSLAHLAHLHARIMSTSSRVLVTGDLNAGKSTVVNALLRRGGVDEFGWPEGVMPVDQQPLTGRFVEVYGVRGGAQEEVHVVKPGVKDGEYNREDPSTYDIVKVQDLSNLVAEQEASAPPLKVYLCQRDADPASPAASTTILHNGILDISLIDAPGLNRDVIPTTETFTRSPSIDVIIFVVSAANHFTLSAKEFILAAGQEKARMFIVVNRFDEVRDKEKCKRAVLEQIKTLSPRTWDERDELVHFVDSAKIAIQCSRDAPDAATTAAVDDAFVHLEQSLRSFVLLNRAKSKLGPAETYLTHLLADIELLASANAVVANTERSVALEQVERVKPVVEAMKRGQDGLEERLDEEEEQVGLDVRKVVSEGVEDALVRIAQGQLALSTRYAMPTYPGLLGVWDYATQVRRVMLKSLEHAVVALEEETKRITAKHVYSVVEAGEAHLPSDVERSARVFNPDAMFGGKQTAAVAARVGLGARTDLVHVSMSDIFDLSHQVSFFKSTLVHSGAIKGSSEDLPLINLASLGTSFSALTLLTGTAGLGSSLFGLKTLLDSAVGLGDVFTDKTSRRWAGPVVGAVILGSIVWIIHDLPRAIPVNVGRHLSRSLRTRGAEDVAWTDAQTERMAREARKVIRLASWDLRERFRTALEARGRVVQEAERNERKARHAVEWFRGVEARVVDIRGEMGKSVFN